MIRLARSARLESLLQAASICKSVGLLNCSVTFQKKADQHVNFSASGCSAFRISRLLLARDMSRPLDTEVASESQNQKDVLILVDAIRSLTRPPVNHFTFAKNPFDERRNSIDAFVLFLSEADNKAGCADAAELKTNKRLIPIAVNCGAAGSGKTTQLQILCNEFSNLRPGGHFVYCSLNGEKSELFDFDSCSSISVRLAHRIIHAAANPSLTLESFWVGVRHTLCMAAIGVAPSSPHQVTMEGVLGAPDTIVAVCRGVLGLDGTMPLLLAVDELRKFGEPSYFAVSALRTLGSMSQWSFVVQRGTGTQPTYVVGSAYAAIDPSNRPVHFLPLPPLQLSCGWDARISEAAGSDLKEKSVGRYLLWLSQGNARGMTLMFEKLLRAKAEDMKWETQFEEMKNCVNNSRDAIDSYIAACARMSRDPAVIIQNLFWARTSMNDMSNMQQALLGDAAGLCSIIRAEGGDTIYMHPVCVEQLCKELKATVYSKPYMSVVIELCSAMQKLPSLPDGKSNANGKLYAKIVTLAFVCRVATCFASEFTVGELLGSNRTSCQEKYGGIDSRPLATVLLEKQNMDAFPRAAEKITSEGDPTTIDWRNVECSDVPHIGKYFIPNDTHNTVLDSGLSLRSSISGAKPVLVAFKMKEETTEMFSFAGRERRVKMMTWRGPHRHVSKCLDQQDMVLVAVTPNSLPATLATWYITKYQVSSVAKFRDDRHEGFSCHEALVTTSDIRQWSPMVAYSACEARALQTAGSTKSP